MTIAILAISGKFLLSYILPFYVLLPLIAYIVNRCQRLTVYLHSCCLLLHSQIEQNEKCCFMCKTIQSTIVFKNEVHHRGCNVVNFSYQCLKV